MAARHDPLATSWSALPGSLHPCTTPLGRSATLGVPQGASLELSTLLPSITVSGALHCPDVSCSYAI